MMIRVDRNLWVNPNHVMRVEEGVSGDHPLSTVFFLDGTYTTVTLPANEVALALNENLNVPPARFDKWANNKALR